MNRTSKTETYISAQYNFIGDRQCQAADYTIKNEFDSATQSPWAVAVSSVNSPDYCTGRAGSHGSEDCEMLRQQVIPDISRDAVAPYADKSVQVTSETSQSGIPLRLSRHFDSCSIADYAAYMAGWFQDNRRVAGHNGIAMGSALCNFNEQNTIVVISKSPYASGTLRTTKATAEQGALVIAITNSHAFPGPSFAQTGFVVRTYSPHFFYSYVATMVLVEAMIDMLLSRVWSGADHRMRIVERRNLLLDKFSTA